MNETATASRPGSAKMQGDLWSVRARDYADLQERQFRPLYEAACCNGPILPARAPASMSAAVWVPPRKYLPKRSQR